VTGAIGDTMEEAITALPQVIALDRKKVRHRFEQRFSATRMAKDYVRIYHKLLALTKAGDRHEQERQRALPDGKHATDLRL
ncbi:MAG: glycosyltransferase family 4 protein, partial [Pseudolabrys sp.]